MPANIDCYVKLYNTAVPGSRVYSENSQKLCPHCNKPNTLHYTKSVLKRNIIVLKHRENDYYLEMTTIDIFLCRCNNKKCNSKFRVLPVDIHPQKQYSLSAIIYLCFFYITNNYVYRQITKNALTNSPESMVYPHYSTIHRWISGLGRTFLDLPIMPNIKFVSIKVLLSITSTYTLDFYQFYAKTVFPVNPNKYRSQRRLEEIEAVEQLVTLSDHFFPSSHYTSFSKWCGWLINKIVYVQSIVFPSGYKFRVCNNSP